MGLGKSKEEVTEVKEVINDRDDRTLEEKTLAYEKHSYYKYPEHEFDQLPVENPTKAQCQPLSSTLLLSKNLDTCREFKNKLATHGFCVVTLEDSEGGLQVELVKEAQEYFALPDLKSTSKTVSAGYKFLFFPNRDNIREPERREVFQLYKGVAKDLKFANYRTESFEKAFHTLYDFQWKLTTCLLEGLALSLELDEKKISDLCGNIDNNDGTNMCVFRYEDKYGYKSTQKCMIHEDPGFLTVVPKSTNPGLQIIDASHTKWLNVEPHMPENSVVVYAGLCMELMTGKLLKATTHRVIREPNATRFSIPFAMKPLKASTISPVAGEKGVVHEDFELPCTYTDVLRAENWHDIQRKMKRYDDGQESVSSDQDADRQDLERE